MDELNEPVPLLDLPGSERLRTNLKDRPCDECGEAGRYKAITARRGEATRYFCHDEEKSCYNYRRGNYFGDKA